MVSRLLVQLSLILILTIVVFIAGYQFDQIKMSIGGYLITLFASIVGGAVYLSLGQAIVGRVQNPETVNSTVRLVYFAFIMVGMFGETGLVPQIRTLADWSPYGTVRNIIISSLEPSKWSNHTTMALLLTLGYTLVFSVLGIKWFKWSNK
jgi:ABC-2 type transport system permease protein